MEVIGSIFSQLIWVFFIVTFITPILRQKALDAARYRLIHSLEQRRGTRLITLVHRQEQMSLFGIPIFRYINIEDSEAVLRAIRLTPPSLPIDLLLHTPGGLVLASEQIAMALREHDAPVTVFIPHYAMSGGAMIALAANQIVMDRNAVIGPVDPQIGEYPAASILTVAQRKHPNEIDDKTLIFADVAEKAIRQVQSSLKYIMLEKFNEETASELAKILTEGRWTHDYPIKVHEARNFGLPITTDVPDEVYALMDLYPQPPQRRPSVEYIPIPYSPPGTPPRPSGEGPKGE